MVFENWIPNKKIKIKNINLKIKKTISIAKTHK